MVSTTCWPESFAVGARLLALRQERGLSQRELARRAGVTNANLSMIEQGRVSPSITTLEKILAVFELPLAVFFAQTTQSAASIVRGDSFVQIVRSGSEYRLLPPPVGSALPSLAEHTLAPGAASEGSWLGRRGWVSGWVQAGELKLALDGQMHRLQPGDGFGFHLKRAHSFINHTQAPVILTLAVAGDGEPDN